MVMRVFWSETGKYKALVFGGDLLFFTSPTSQPPASMAVHRTGWYFRRGLFPFLATNSILLSMFSELLVQTACNTLISTLSRLYGYYLLFLFADGQIKKVLNCLF